MIRLLLFLFLFYALYRLGKEFMSGLTSRGPLPRDTLGEIDDEMVKDPNCQVYIPKTSAIKRRIRGEEYYFCSPGCADEYSDRD